MIKKCSLGHGAIEYNHISIEPGTLNYVYSECPLCELQSKINKIKDILNIEDEE